LEVVVPGAARRWREAERDWGVELEKRRITKRHRQECVRVARNVGDELERAGLACRPEDFGQTQLDHLLSGPWARHEGNTKAYDACLLNRFLKRAGNLAVEKAELRFDRTPIRPKCALTREERVLVLDAAKQLGIVPYAMIVLMLTMNFRRSEVIRLTVTNVESDPVVFVGKGRQVEQGGGKIRRVPKHPLFRELLPELMAHRAQVVAGHEVGDTGLLFPHFWGGKLVPWHKAWVDRRFIIPAFVTAGARKKWNLNHALRRTWGRAAVIELGIPLEKASRLMGHSDTRTTLGYLALNDDDDREVMDSLRDAFGSIAIARSRKEGG
jgi:integrase